MHTLVIDTSYGSTVGLVGQEPIIETDSRTHVEQLQVNIDQACTTAEIQPHEIERIVVGIGPAPFTGLRAGIVTAKAIAAATGADLLGQNDLTPSAVLMHNAHQQDPKLANLLPLDTIQFISETAPVVALTLAVNDARRKQLYFALYSNLNANEGNPTTIIEMDIDAPEHIAQRVNQAVQALHAHNPETRYIVDIVGHGANKYAQHWQAIQHRGVILDKTVLDLGSYGLELFADCANRDSQAKGNPQAVEPLYLRRPDVSVPHPLKHVLNHPPVHQNTTQQ